MRKEVPCLGTLFPTVQVAFRRQCCVCVVQDAENLPIYSRNCPADAGPLMFDSGTPKAPPTPRSLHFRYSQPPSANGQQQPRGKLPRQASSRTHAGSAEDKQAHRMYTHSQRLLPITQCIHDAPKGERRGWTFISRSARYNVLRTTSRYCARGPLAANAFVCSVFVSGASFKIFQPKRLNLTLDPAPTVRWSRKRKLLSRGRLPLFSKHQSTAHHSNHASELSHATVAKGRNWSSIQKNYRQRTSRSMQAK